MLHHSGVVLVHTEPPEARKPSARWRLYVFKKGEPFGDPLHIHRWAGGNGRAEKDGRAGGRLSTALFCCQACCA